METHPEHENPSPQEQPAARNPFFPMVLLSASIFILTILAMVAVIFSDPRAPVAQFLNANAGRLILAEVVVTLIVGFLALVVDRRQSRRQKSANPDRDEKSAQNSPKS